MITLRSANDRGHANFGWLDSHHTFSFASYYDPRHMGVSALRVINDDWVKPGMGFDTHPHRDMGVVGCVLSGSIEHKDTMGFHTVLKAGDIQVMSAGTGIRHSEFNPSQTEDLNFLQIWIQPNIGGVKPQYQEKNFSDSKGITLVVSADGRHGSLPIHQEANIYKLSLHQGTDSGQQTHFETLPGRTYYLHIAQGQLVVNDLEMSSGDGAMITKETLLSFETIDAVDALLFELP
jgi:redox-sensitive bicupin YhaK (pirin superfamily)